MAQLGPIFNRQLTVHLMILPGKLGVDPYTRKKRACTGKEVHLPEDAADRAQLVQGDTVRIQNQVGPRSKKWDKTGTVVETRGHQ